MATWSKVNLVLLHKNGLVMAVVGDHHSITLLTPTCCTTDLVTRQGRAAFEQTPSQTSSHNGEELTGPVDEQPATQPTRLCTLSLGQHRAETE